MAHFIFSGVFLVWAAFVATSDIRFRRVSNSLVLVGLVCGVGGAYLNASPFGILPKQAMIGVLVGLVAFFPLFLLRVMGAADVKIFAVIGVWCGANALLWIWIAASLAAGIHVLALMLLTRTSIGALWQWGRPAMELGKFRATPYAACLAAPAAAWVVFLAATGA
ncbi:A24 family peptidase [Burkholderia cenocepacia]|uniref:A24 family peptidase n=1 Tax=Burkholderia cenocepacia TaxID=95486 RepID=UPI00196A9D4B|nr:prepilin peptidase [Burkholderia cenocepacia]MBN3505319.1 prepilin peptidase [Burkholderia cenocepacia]MCO1396728.1 prepilin peptidase [Burkholderia cenocepacia]MCO1409302.1 prepilin peptidase [Burkholderia cenocepacia]MCO8321862.1 prepilin peptidase [Burkholderia cenocepacia]MCO8329146.1 prepilin peptidase [Burkholderia cenocepacia]